MRYILILTLICVALSGCVGNSPTPTVTSIPATAFAPVPTSEFPTPTFDGTPIPEITQFQVSNYMPKRGDTVTLSWDVKDGRDLKIETYDLDYFPSAYSQLPDNVVEHLPATGTLDLTIPADYKGTGWQVYLTAANGDKWHTERRDLVLADVKQMVLLNIDSLYLTALTAKRGDSVTITWNTHVTTRVSRDGTMTFDQPLSGYENQLFLEFFPVYDVGITPDNPYQHIDNLPLSGSTSFTIPDYAPEYGRLMIDIGLNVDGQPNTYDVRSVELADS